MGACNACNAVLGLPGVLEFADGCVVIDNKALYQAFHHKGSCVEPTSRRLAFHMNKWAVNAMIDITSPLRFAHPGETPTSLEAMLAALNPQPRFSLYTPSRAPFEPYGARPQGLYHHEQPDVEELMTGRHSAALIVNSPAIRDLVKRVVEQAQPGKAEHGRRAGLDGAALAEAELVVDMLLSLYEAHDASAGAAD
ncbi:hypothetical protein WJX72_005131 [[Myrmecia] bisecta]|uniref:Uncharacterized protein n=1 Tax=[Myrmecia] bisecta TaxID=41462 RepID=A0AAW1QAH5_9CHLO